MSTHLYDLQYFVEVCNTRNISRAAERLGITQPTLTQSIRRLEHAVGTSLLTRSKKGVELTHAGQKMRQQIQGIIHQWENLRASTRSSQNEVTGVIRFGAHVSVALYTLPHFLPDTIRKYPQLEVQLTHNLSRHLTDDVIHLRIDMGLVINPTPHPDLIIKKLAEDQVTFWGTKVKSDVLIYDPHLLQAQHLIQKIKKNKTYSRSIHTSSLELATELACKGVGHAILPARVAQHHDRKLLHKISGAPSYTDEIALIYRVENKSLKIVEAFVDEVKNVFDSKN